MTLKCPKTSFRVVCKDSCTNHRNSHDLGHFWRRNGFEKCYRVYAIKYFVIMTFIRFVFYSPSQHGRHARVVTFDRRPSLFMKPKSFDLTLSWLLDSLANYSLCCRKKSRETLRWFTLSLLCWFYFIFCRESLEKNTSSVLAYVGASRVSGRIAPATRNHTSAHRTQPSLMNMASRLRSRRTSARLGRERS